MKRAYERFLSYVAYDTTSDEKSTTFPSTPGQKVLAAVLEKEMKELGIPRVVMDENGYVYGEIPATPGWEEKPAIGLIAHMDTSSAASGHDIHPRIVENYDGGDIVLNKEKGITLKVSDFPVMPRFQGEDLIVTDGTTLLGGDNKAGIAEILTAVEELMASDKPHGRVCVAFTPDEEIGKGASRFDVAGFGADFAYTVDGGELGEVEYETFNAAQAIVTVHGRSIHPGAAKNKMRNAILMAMDMHRMLPVFENPMYTEGREGFYHLGAIEGDEECTEMRYIIRDHDRSVFESKKERMQKIIDYLNDQYGAGTFELHMEDQYYNMGDILKDRMDIVDRARRAFEANGIQPVTIPVRGGTDGSQLTYKGLPCPNLSSCDMNAHGRFEFVPVGHMDRMVQVLLTILRMEA